MSERNALGLHGASPSMGQLTPIGEMDPVPGFGAMSSKLDDLLECVTRATGADPVLDQRIATYLDEPGAGEPVPPYTASVDSCIALIRRVLPGWGWHVGYGPRGILPHASVHNSEDRFESEAPTVPLDLMAALLKARGAQDKGKVLCQ